MRRRIAVAMALSLMLIATSANAEEARAELMLTLGDVSLNKLPFVIAYDEGVFDRNGLDVTPKFTRGSVEIIRRSGVDVSEEFILEEGVATPIKIGGAAPTIVRLTTRAGSWDPLILGSTHLSSRWRIIGRADIASPAELKGKRMGYSGVGAVSHFMALSFAEAMGWDPDLDWSLLGGALGVVPLEKGWVDASIGPELHATMAVAKGYRVIVDLGDYDLPVAGSSFLVDRAWFEDHRDVARRFIRSAVEAIAIMKTDKRTAFRAMTRWYEMTDPDLQEYFYAEAAKLPSKPYPPVEGIRKVMQIYDSHEMRRYELEHFYDDSFVRELDESGYIDSLYE